MKSIQRIAIVALTLVLTICCLAPAQATGELPEVLARVNDKPIYKQDVLRYLDTTGITAARLERAIGRELISQAIVKEKHDEDPRYQTEVARASGHFSQIAALRQRELAILARLYEDTIPELAFIDPSQITATEIKNFFAENPTRFDRLQGNKRRLAAARVIAVNRYQKTQLGALKNRLSNSRFRVNGKKIPATIVQAAIDKANATKARARWEPSQPLFDKIKGIVVKQAAKQQGVRPAEIEQSDRRVAALLTKATVEIVAAGRKAVKCNIPNEVDMSDRGRVELIGSDLQLLMSMKASVMAAEAREKGIDKSSAFRQQTSGIQALIEELDAVPGSNLYYAHHGLGDKTVKVIDIELDQWYLTIMHALMDGSQAGGRENFRVFLETARRNSQAKGRMTGNQADTGESIPEVTLTDNELDAWYLAIMHALMNKGTTTGQDTFRAHLETAKLKWRREGHLQTLRQAANIEILVDLN